MHTARLHICTPRQQGRGVFGARRPRECCQWQQAGPGAAVGKRAHCPAAPDKPPATACGGGGPCVGLRVVQGVGRGRTNQHFSGKIFDASLFLQTITEIMVVSEAVFAVAIREAVSYAAGNVLFFLSVRWSILCARSLGESSRSTLRVLATVHARTCTPLVMTVTRIDVRRMVDPILTQSAAHVALAGSGYDADG
jgi:hypothetical protein